MSQKHTDLLAQLKDHNEHQLHRLLVEHLTRQKRGCIGKPPILPMGTGSRQRLEIRMCGLVKGISPEVWLVV